MIYLFLSILQFFLCNFCAFPRFYPKIHKKMSFHAISIHFLAQMLYNFNAACCSNRTKELSVNNLFINKGSTVLLRKPIFSTWKVHGNRNVKCCLLFVLLFCRSCHSLAVFFQPVFSQEKDKHKDYRIVRTLFYPVLCIAV